MGIHFELPITILPSECGFYDEHSQCQRVYDDKGRINHQWVGEVMRQHHRCLSSGDSVEYCLMNVGFMISTAVSVRGCTITGDE